MMPEVYNKLWGISPPDSIYVGRPSKWGNPFVIGPDGDRTAVIAKYRTWLLTQSHLMTSLKALTGKNLLCWCAPLPCHADVLLELANPSKEPSQCTGS